MKIVVEYVWIGGNNDLHSKTRVLDMKKNEKDEFVISIPQWSYDGSSTDQATSENSEIILIPRSIFKCPFRRGDNAMVICDTYKVDGTPAECNYRAEAEIIFNLDKEAKPLYSMKQEFFLLSRGKTFDKGKQGQYYCSVGMDNVFGRDIMEKHLAACMFAGLAIKSINSEVAPCQWQYEIGHVEGVTAGDHLWLSRFILERICEQHNVNVSWEPKAIPGNWNTSKCAVDYSTLAMREGEGLECIHDAINKLAKNHNKYMETCFNVKEYDDFAWGIGNKNTSIRISNETVKNKSGSLEDRRPTSNMDPYRVTSMLFRTTHVGK